MAEWIVEIGDGNPHIKKMIPLVRCKDCRKNPKISMVGCPMAGLKTWKEDGFCFMGEKVTE